MPAGRAFATIRPRWRRPPERPAREFQTMKPSRPADLGSLYRLQVVVLAVSFVIAASVAPDVAGPFVARVMASIERQAARLLPRLQALRVAAATLPQAVQNR